MKVPLITDIRGNCLDDGPGIRTIIFFKGCPLHCIWYHNPETNSSGPELSVSRDDCIRCGNCALVCPQDAISPLHPEITDRKKCILCFKCTGHCPAKAMQMQFNVVSSDTMRAAMADPEQYRNLMVRISGYNAYFTELNRDLQLELIRRADYKI